MRTKIQFYFLLSIFSLSVLACSKDDDSTVDSDDDGVSNTETNVSDLDNSIQTNTKDTVFSNAVTIAWSTDGVSVINPYQSQGVSISVSGGDVVVTSSADFEVNYVLSGTHTDASIKIYSDTKFGIGLNGVDLINTDGAVINIQSEKRGTIYLVGGTSNRLIDNNLYGSEHTDAKGTIFSEGQLVFDGSGELILKGYYKHAICSDDFILMEGGTIAIESAYKDGIHVNDYFQIDGGTLSITSSGDGIECEEGYITLNGGTISINSADDGIVASYEGTDTSVSSDITLGGTTLSIATSGQKAMGVKSEQGVITVTGGIIGIKTSGIASKGFKTGSSMIVRNGQITIATTGNSFYDTDESEISSAAGVKCDGNFSMENGTLIITSSGSGGKGINSDGTVTIGDGTISVTTSGGLFQYGSDDTAAKAIKSDGNLVINGGTITIKTSANEAEGLESKNILTINGGTIEVEAYDDCINASNSLVINGGTIYCYSTTNDGIDSNGTMTITGGTIFSSGSTSPEEGLDCDNNTLKITGGLIVGFGGSTSTPTSSVTTQRCLVYGGTGSANQILHIESSDGTSVLTCKIPRAYSQMTLLFSSVGLVANSSYTIYKDGSISGGTAFHGLYTGSTYTKGTSVQTFTSSSMITTVGNTSQGGGGGR
jgi:hypothetical protein